MPDRKDLGVRLVLEFYRTAKLMVCGYVFNWISFFYAPSICLQQESVSVAPIL